MEKLNRSKSRGHRIMGEVAVLVPALAVGVATAAAGGNEPVPAPAGQPWRLVTPAAAFSPRDSAKGCVFKEKMWLNNGYYHGNVDICDLWNSDDGKTWNRVLEKTPYDHYAEFAAFNGRLWAVRQSVWSSPDGVTWTREIEKGPFGSCAELFVFKGKLWTLNGTSAWNTTNGLDWACVGKDLPLDGREKFAFAIYRDALWVMGGCLNRTNEPPEKHYPGRTTFNDVWRSADGATWERVAEKAPWTRRQWFKAADYRGRLWIFGGFDNVNGVNLGDVWSTMDGRTWERFAPDPPWKPRHEPTLFLFKDNLYLVAGNSWPVLNDVWQLVLP